MPRGVYPRKSRSVTTHVDPQALKDIGATRNPIYMELVVPPAGLTLKVLEHPQHVSFTLHINHEGISQSPSNGKKMSRMLTWHTIRQIASMGLLAKE